MVMILFTMGCDEEDHWENVNDDETSQEIIELMEDYKLAWEESLSTQSYSIMESYFVGNSQVFHMERKQHQQLTGERKIERFLEADDIEIEVNQFDEYRVRWNETVEIDQLDSIYEETRARNYYLGEGRNGFRIIAIERSDEVS